LGWALVGFAVAAGITFSRVSSDFGPLLMSSILFAEVVGFTSLVSARLIFPLYAGLPFALRVALQVATLVVGTVASQRSSRRSPLPAREHPLLGDHADQRGAAVRRHRRPYLNAMRRELGEFPRCTAEVGREIAIARGVQRALPVGAVGAWTGSLESASRAGVGGTSASSPSRGPHRRNDRRRVRQGHSGAVDGGPQASVRA
jgi:hypothetical protein